MHFLFVIIFVILKFLQLLGATNPDQVIILHSLPLHQYFSSEEDESSTHHLTCLLTRFWKQDPLAKFLSPSNIVSGEPAAGKN